jgi:membrane-associated protease RseP (regulator of RpoE activity)
VLLAYNGIDVVGHDFNLSELLVPQRKIDVRVKRDGEPRDYTLTIAKAPARVMMRPQRVTVGAMPVMPAMPGTPLPPKLGMLRAPMLPGNIFIIARDGVLGATMSTVSPELERALNLGGTGVLVNQVAESSPAAVAGLRAGDVVVRVDSKPVETLEELRAVAQANMDRHVLAMRVIRDHKPRDVTVKW